MKDWQNHHIFTKNTHSLMQTITYNKDHQIKKHHESKDWLKFITLWFQFGKLSGRSMKDWQKHHICQSLEPPWMHLINQFNLGLRVKNYQASKDWLKNNQGLIWVGINSCISMKDWHNHHIFTKLKTLTVWCKL